MSNEYQCEILKETQPLKEYSQYNNDSSVVYGMMDTKDGSQGVYTVYADKDRTPQLNCLIEWKNDLTSIIQDKYPNIELEQTQADIDALQNKLNEYANKIEEIDGLKESLNGYNNTKLKYMVMFQTIYNIHILISMEIYQVNLYHILQCLKSYHMQ